MTDYPRVTVPFCGACGYDATTATAANGDIFCNACGADLTHYGFADLFPPDDLEATGGSLAVTFTWTAALDTQDLLYRIDGGPLVLIEGATAAGEAVAALEGQKVAGQVRTILNGVAGPWSTAVAATATA